MDLEDLLGEKWYIRITNRNGDFSYVVPSTVSFYSRKMLEYECIQDGDKMTFEPTYVLQNNVIVLCLGNKTELKEFISKTARKQAE